MAENEDLTGAQSYYESNSELIRKFGFVSDDKYTAELLVSFLTIKNLWDIWFDPEVNLEEDVTKEFVKEFLMKEATNVLRDLATYTGTDRKGIQEAFKSMDLFRQGLLQLQGLLPDGTEKMPAANLKLWAQAHSDCQNSINSAYRFLEHLEGEIQKLQGGQSSQSVATGNPEK